MLEKLMISVLLLSSFLFAFIAMSIVTDSIAARAGFYDSPEDYYYGAE